MRWGTTGATLVELLGEDALAALVREFGGQLIRVPSIAGLKRIRRSRRVRNALIAGLTIREAAVREHIHRSTAAKYAKVSR